MLWLMACTTVRAWGMVPLQDSLLNKIEAAKTPCERLYPSYELAKSYYGVDAGEMAHWGQVSLDAAIQCQNGEAHFKAENLLGVCFLSQANYRDALTHFLAAYRLADSMGHTQGLSQCLNNLGVIYWHQKAYDKALVIYRRALTLLNPEQDSMLMGRYYYNIGMIYQDHLLAPDSAEYYYRQAMSVAVALDDTIGQVDTHNSLGLLQKAQRETPMAEFHFRRAMALATPGGQADQLFYPLYNLARLLLARRDLPEAQRLAEQSLPLAQQTRSYDMLQSSYALLAAVDSLAGRLGQSLYHYQLHTRYLDSLRQQEHDQALQELQARFELAESTRQNQVLRQREADQMRIIRTQRYTLIGTAIFTFIMASLLVALIVLARQRSQALYDLRVASEDKDALLGIVAHDLKAPLSNIREMAHLITEQKEPSHHQRFGWMILQEARRGEHLVRNLLDFEALAKGKQNPKPEIFDVVLLLDQVAGTYHSLAQAKSMELIWQSQLQRATLHLDPVYLTRILDNLLTNAIKFSPTGGRVTLGLAPQQAGLKIWVADEGPGISEADQGRLFQQYERLGNRPTKGEATTGLGLSIVKSLSEALGIQVSVHSRLGKGTTFTVYIPPSLLTGPLETKTLVG